MNLSWYNWWRVMNLDFHSSPPERSRNIGPVNLPPMKNWDDIFARCRVICDQLEQQHTDEDSFRHFLFQSQSLFHRTWYVRLLFAMLLHPLQVSSGFQVNPWKIWILDGAWCVMVRHPFVAYLYVPARRVFRGHHGVKSSYCHSAEKMTVYSELSSALVTAPIDIHIFRLIY